MKKKNWLTNERLNKYFESPFDLVNYAIKQTRERVLRGESLGSEGINEIIDFLEKKIDQKDKEEVCQTDDVSC